MNEKNTPTKPPRTPSKSKEYANQNTKYAILIKRRRQPKYQVLYSKILIYAVLSRGKFCREFTHFFGVLF